MFWPSTDTIVNKALLSALCKGSQEQQEQQQQEQQLTNS